MSIIDDIKADVQNAETRSRFDRMVLAGALTEAQITYGKSLYRNAFRVIEAAKSEGAARAGLVRGTWVTTPNAEDGECSVWEVIGEKVTVQTEGGAWLTYTVADLMVVA